MAMDPNRCAEVVSPEGKYCKQHGRIEQRRLDNAARASRRVVETRK